MINGNGSEPPASAVVSSAAPLLSCLTSPRVAFLTVPVRAGLAWFVLTPSNRIPPTVVDTYGVEARDTAAYQIVPHGRPTVAEPIKACDMAWNMLGDRKVEL